MCVFPHLYLGIQSEMSFVFGKRPIPSFLRRLAICEYLLNHRSKIPCMKKIALDFQICSSLHHSYRHHILREWIPPPPASLLPLPPVFTPSLGSVSTIQFFGVTVLPPCGNTCNYTYALNVFRRFVYLFNYLFVYLIIYLCISLFLHRVFYIQYCAQVLGRCENML